MIRMLRTKWFIVAPLTAWLAGADVVSAQPSAVTALPERPPATAQYRLGPLLLNPVFSVPEIGHDSNVFSEATHPKQDYVVRLVPALDVYAESGLFTLAARSGSTFTYYHRYSSERAIGHDLRARVVARASRLRPWMGGASIAADEPPSPEIDLRVRRRQTELAVGIDFELSSLARLGVSANRVDERFGDGETVSGVLLADALDRRTDALAASMRLAPTPFTTVTARAYVAQDRFDRALDRDARSRGVDVIVGFAPEAIVRGTMSLGLRDHRPEDPLLARYHGITGRGELSTIVLGRAMLVASYGRDVRYSFDRSEGYYVETGGALTYTQRVGGPFDVQIRVARQDLDYRGRPVSTRGELLWSYQAGIGYSLENRSRIGISYEYIERTGDTFAERVFSRRRLFGSFTYEFWK
jgi:hypothetical protein